ncbi:MAG TPA: D-sedoheptulose 7-phosphate isomerase [Terracidiphilus sp.]
MSSLSPSLIFERAISDHIEVIQTILSQQKILERIAEEMTRAVFAGNKVLWCGNGGSAADSQHMAAELMGRFRRERRGLASIALTTDTSILTAIGNDYGFERVFARQVEALCVKGDVVVGISTSGNSKNVCAALQTAQQLGAFTVALTGAGGGAMASIADITLRIASQDTARIQEGHILCGHMLCDWVELAVCEREQAAVLDAAR